ncbi:MAG: hypothetical protein HYY24_18085 [Verrucomicrobia bacterium]|nr:hypothetical protein [Verrucomicrobiota bacterium]
MSTADWLPFPLSQRERAGVRENAAKCPGGLNLLAAAAGDISFVLSLETNHTSPA